MNNKPQHVTRAEFIKVCLAKGKDYVPHGTKRPVICFETGDVYKSASEAARVLGISRDCVRSSCRRSVVSTDYKYYCLRDRCVYHFKYHDVPRADDEYVWKPIAFVGGMFEVSDTGQFRRASTRRPVKTTVNKATGSVYVTFNVDNVSHAFSVSRIVAETFMPEHKETDIVIHIDGDVANNRLSNLRWGTRKDMMSRSLTRERLSVAQRTSERVHAWRISAHAKAIEQAFKEYGKSKRKKVICEETGVVYPSIAEAARTLGLSHKSISGSCKRVNSRFSMSKQAGKSVLHFRLYNPDDSDAYKRRHIMTSQDRKDKSAPFKHRVRCLETGIVYDSIADAAEALGMYVSNISKMCKRGDPQAAHYFRNGKVLYHFRYADEQ